MTLVTFGSLMHEIEPKHLEETMPTFSQSIHRACKCCELCKEYEPQRLEGAKSGKKHVL